MATEGWKQAFNALSALECEVIRRDMIGDKRDLISAEISRSEKAEANLVANLFDTSKTQYLFDRSEFKAIGIDNTSVLHGWWGALTSHAVNHMDEFFTDPKELDHKRRQGEAQSVAEEAGREIALLKTYLHWCRSSPPTYVLESLCGLLLVRGFAIYNVTARGAIQNSLQPLITDLQNIAGKLDDRRPQVFSHILQALIADVQENYLDYHRHSCVVTQLEHTYYPVYDAKFRRHRMYAEGEGYLKVEGKTKKAIDLVQRTFDNDRCPSKMKQMMVLITKACCLEQLLHPQSTKLAQEAWELYQETPEDERLPTEGIKVVKVILEVQSRVGGIDKACLEACGNEGLKIAQRHGFLHSTQYIQRHLNSLLN